MLLRFVDFCAALNRICSFLAVRLLISSQRIRDEVVVLPMINSCRYKLLEDMIDVYSSHSFKDPSCKIMGADDIKLWWRKYVFNEASFLSSHAFGGFAQHVWFRTSVFWTSSQGLFTEFCKCLEKHTFFELLLMATTVKTLVCS